MKKISAFVILFLIITGAALHKSSLTTISTIPNSHWLLLHRKSNVEYLYQGIPGNQRQSRLIKVFKVKTGVQGESPTPLHRLLGRDYWVITDKQEVKDNPEIAPYFLTLNIPVADGSPYGPIPYLECEGQCDWVLPGSFGLHGVSGNPERLSASNAGSSGCIRHADEDITYLYKLLDPTKDEIRYYIEDL